MLLITELDAVGTLLCVSSSCVTPLMSLPCVAVEIAVIAGVFYSMGSCLNLARSSVLVAVHA